MKLLSLDEAAKRLGVGRSTTKTLLGQGRLRSLKLGKRRLIPEHAVEEFIVGLESEQNATIGDIVR
jgi:excisionase family DNA binding protein